MKYKAYAPGSVTMFFEIVDNDNPVLRGSKGVGVSVAPGAITEVEDGPFRILLNEREVYGEIQRFVAEMYRFKGTIKTTTALPVSQGFGMSSAIALSTSLALASIYRKTYFHAARIAHLAELHSGTGLGDVATAYEGGFTFRRKAGIQPYGRVDRINYSGPIKLVVFGDELETSKIILNEEWKEKIKVLGKKAIRNFTRRPTFENALKISRDFSFSLGLMSSEMKSFIEDCKSATMALLGNSAIVFGNCKIPPELQTYDVTLSSRAVILK